MTASASWTLWSTTALVVVTDAAALEEATRLVRGYLTEVELAASRFRDDSEVRLLARDEHDGTVISDVLADLLAEALRAARRTDGRVDPTVGTAMRRIGYDRDIDLVLHEDPVSGAPVSAVVRPVPGWRRVRLDGNRLCMPRGVELDLGATAKAVAADRCAALVRDALRTGVLVSLGGDIATAGPTPSGGWRVLVQDRPDDPATTATLGPGDAIATSSSVSRTWVRGTRRMHHVVDPATGGPAPTPWRSVTVAAGTCAEANTASTASIVLGEEAVGWLTRLGLPARLVRHGGEVFTVEAWRDAA